MPFINNNERPSSTDQPRVESHPHRDKDSSSTAQLDQNIHAEIQYMSGFQLYLMVAGLVLAVLLVALDNAIITTAIPTITARFNSLSDVGWYGSAFLITTCACQPISGKIYQQFSLKYSYLSFLLIFEIGSLLCGVAPSSTVLIVGRAVAGIGVAGLFSGALTIIAQTIPPRSQPAYIGVILASLQLANSLGPLLGGALTQHASWRWCFYINLPCGAVTACLLFFFFHVPDRPDEAARLKMPLLTKIGHFDLPGFVLFVSAVLMLLLAIQWGGSTYSWHSATIIGLLCGSVCTITVFGFWQWQQQDEASIPPRIFLERSVLTGAVVNFFIFGAMQVAWYYLPIWFQVSKGVGPTKSGVMLLPAVISNAIFSVVAGGLVTVLGPLNPWLYGGASLIIIAGGLLSTFHTTTSSAYWIGYQFILGAGAGSAIQMPTLAVMVTLSHVYVSIGTAIVTFFQFLGGAIFLSISQEILTSQLTKELASRVPNVDPKMVIAVGATAVRTVFKGKDLEGVLEAYNAAIVTIYYLCIAGGGCALAVSFGLPWINMKGKALLPSTEK